MVYSAATHSRREMAVIQTNDAACNDPGQLEMLVPSRTSNSYDRVRQGVLDVCRQNEWTLSVLAEKSKSGLKLRRVFDAEILERRSGEQRAAQLRQPLAGPCLQLGYGGGRQRSKARFELLAQ